MLTQIAMFEDWDILDVRNEVNDWLKKAGDSIVVKDIKTNITNSKNGYVVTRHYVVTVMYERVG